VRRGFVPKALKRRKTMTNTKRVNSWDGKENLTPAEKANLQRIFRNGPFEVYVNRGFTGFANPRVQIYGADGLLRQIFERLRKKCWIRPLGEDDLKGLWDISEDGISALVRFDPIFIEIHPDLIARRLNTPFDVFKFDNLGLIKRISETSRSRDNYTDNIIALGVSQSDTRFEDANEKTSRNVAINLNEKGVSLGGRINNLIKLTERLLLEESGSLVTHINLRTKGDEILHYHSFIKGRSYDVTSIDRISKKFSERVSLNENKSKSDVKWTECPAYLRLVIERKKNGTLRSGRLAKDFSLLSLIDDVRLSIANVVPEALKVGSCDSVDLAFGARRTGSSENFGVQKLAWLSHRNGYKRNLRRAIKGKNAIKAATAIQGVGVHCGIDPRLLRQLQITATFPEFYHLSESLHR
jgi:hypothetical protein